MLSWWSATSFSIHSCSTILLIASRWCRIDRDVQSNGMNWMYRHCSRADHSFSKEITDTVNNKATLWIEQGSSRRGDNFIAVRGYPKVSGLAVRSENCKWYNSLPIGAVVSLFCELACEFCLRNRLCCFPTSVYCCKSIFGYRLSPETFRYTLVIN